MGGLPRVVLLALLLACSDPPAPHGRPEPRFDLATGAATHAVDLLAALDTAQLDLPRGSGPPAHADGRFALTGTWTARERPLAGLPAWTHPLPFQNDMPRPNYAPWGARLTIDGADVPFVNQIDDVKDTRRGWLVERDRVVLLTAEPPTGAVELRADALGAALAARAWDGSDAHTWARTEVTLGGLTRPGIHLPAGAQVRFTLTLPAGATLDAGLAPLPHPLTATPDEGSVRVVVRVDGDEAASAAVTEAWQPLRADLARWAGRTVTLSLSAEGDAGRVGHAVVTAPVVRVAPARAPRRVVVVGVDTLRQDVLGTHGYARPTSPELDEWAQQAVVFDNAWAPAPRTRPSFRTALTGQWPLSEPGPTLAARLRAQGFRTAGVVANVHLVPRFGFNEGFEHWEYENGARAEVQVDRALAWLDSHADEDSYLFLHLMDPHTWYNAPDAWGGRFQKGARPDGIPEIFDRWQIVSLMKRRSWSPAHEAWIRNAYDEEVAYTSAQLRRFLDRLEAMPGETLTVIHSDHGEELFDHGGFEHNHTLYAELTRAVLWMRPPGGWAGGPHRVQAPTSLADIVPTILDLLGSPREGCDGTSLRPFVDAQAAPQAAGLTRALLDRPLQLGHLMFGTERWGVVSHGRSYILHTGSGDEEVYDLARDPRQQKNRVRDLPAAELATLRADLAKALGGAVHDAYRLRIDAGATDAGFTLTFDAPVHAAGVIDPDALRATRTNLEWGEVPPVLPADVGTFTLDTALREARFVPGPRATGNVVWVACAGECPAATVRVGRDARAPLVAGRVDLAGVALHVTRAPWLSLPQRNEAHGAASAEQLQALEALGYVDPH